MAYEHTPDAAQILGRRIRFTDMFEKGGKKGQMVCAEEEWNQRSLTDEFLLHLDTRGPGCKIEQVDFKDQKKTQEKETQGTPEHTQECGRAVRLSRPEE